MVTAPVQTAGGNAPVRACEKRMEGETIVACQPRGQRDSGRVRRTDGVSWRDRGLKSGRGCREKDDKRGRTEWLQSLPSHHPLAPLQPRQHSASALQDITAVNDQPNRGLIRRLVLHQSPSFNKRQPDVGD